MPYKDPDRQRAAVRCYKVHQRLGSAPDREALLKAEIRSLKVRLKRQSAVSREARKDIQDRCGSGLTGKAELAAVVKRLSVVVEDLEHHGRSAFPGLAIEHAVKVLNDLISDIRIGAVK